MSDSESGVVAKSWARFQDRIPDLSLGSCSSSGDELGSDSSFNFESRVKF